MSNSIPKIEETKYDSFRDFQITKSPDRYWLKTPVANEDIETDLLKINPKDVFITPEEARKTNNTQIIGISIALATILTAAGIFTILRGGTKGLSKYFNNLRNYLEKRVLESNINVGESPNKVLLYCLKAVEDVSAKVEAINNFTSFKDTLFKIIMDKSSPTRKIHEKITRRFEKIGRQAVVSSYENASGKLRETIALTEKISKKIILGNSSKIIEINGIRMTKAEWLNEAKNIQAELVEKYDAHFSKRPATGRYFHMKNTAKALSERFKDMKIFLSENIFMQFVANSAIQKEKLAVQKTVQMFRKEITNTTADLSQYTHNTILEIVKLLGYKDSENIAKIAKLRVDIQKYINDGAKNLTKKKQLISDISKFKTEIESIGTNSEISPAQFKKLLAKIEELQSGIENFKEGQIEEILKIYKNILPENDYQIITKSYKKASKSLDKAIKTETEDFFSKLRDLSIGSAPTDILTILGSFGVLGYNLAKSKDNDQRQSIALKYGFPALAGIGVSLYCNAKLFAGTKSLLFGSISTYIVNRIGEWGYKTLKQHKQSN